LQRDCSITNAELAKKIGLAPASTLERVKKLERAGVIEKYVALLNPEKIGKSIVVLVFIQMSSHTIEVIENFNAYIKKLPEVTECFRIAGENDYLLKVVIENIKTYEEFSTTKLAAAPGIERLNTTFALSTVKYQTQISICEE
jgi:Lrp/AsnC family leucine-responsive transcriptional regulator